VSGKNREWLLISPYSLTASSFNFRFSPLRGSGVSIVSRETRTIMKSLIVDDDFTSRVLLQAFIKEYGTCHVAVNGKEAVEAVRVALELDEPYQLICLDVMMPEMTGQEALEQIRAMEEASRGAYRSRIIMTTAVSDQASVMQAISASCNAFLVKPLDRDRFRAELLRFKLIW